MKISVYVNTQMVYVADQVLCCLCYLLRRTVTVH